jgi:hypothetical protein
MFFVMFVRVRSLDKLCAMAATWGSRGRELFVKSLDNSLIDNYPLLKSSVEHLGWNLAFAALKSAAACQRGHSPPRGQPPGPCATTTSNPTYLPPFNSVDINTGNERGIYNQDSWKQGSSLRNAQVRRHRHPQTRGREPSN